MLHASKESFSALSDVFPALQKCRCQRIVERDGRPCAERLQVGIEDPVEQAASTTHAACSSENACIREDKPNAG